MPNTYSQLVRYSRAGDAFHYRWAARRCLRLIDPHSPLKLVTIEGSRESKLRGEYIIDLAEYSEADARESVTYFQLALPVGLTGNAYNLLFVIDTSNAVAESDESNNTLRLTALLRPD